MAYLTPSDFREDADLWYTKGLTLSDEEASDDVLTALIADMSDRFDLETADHFSPEPGDADPDAVPPVAETTTSIELNGGGGSFLVIPKRVREITKIELRSADGTLTEVDETVYRVVPSLESGERTEGDTDAVYVVTGQFLPDGSVTWPFGAQTVKITGRFGWPETPGRVKRAVALMVYDQLTPVSDQLRRADRWESDDASFTRSRSEPTGIPEVDEIIEDYSRNRVPAV